MAQEVPRLKGWALPWIYPTGLFIRDYLKEHGVGYSQEMWRQLKVARATQGLTTGSYDNFRSNYIWVLKKLGLIEEVRQETVRPEWFRRRYYRIAPGRENDPRWAHPQIAIDPRRGQPHLRRRYKKVREKKIVPRPVTPEELDRIWDTATAFLREYGYVLTREQLETIKPEWSSEVGLYPTFERRVGYVIHKAVQIEYVSRIARRLIPPEEAPAALAREARRVAESLEREWLRRV